MTEVYFFWAVTYGSFASAMQGLAYFIVEGKKNPWFLSGSYIFWKNKIKDNKMF